MKCSEQNKLRSCSCHLKKTTKKKPQYKTHRGGHVGSMFAIALRFMSRSLSLLIEVLSSCLSCFIRSPSLFCPVLPPSCVFLHLLLFYLSCLNTSTVSEYLMCFEFSSKSHNIQQSIAGLIHLDFTSMRTDSYHEHNANFSKKLQLKIYLRRVLVSLRNDQASPWQLVSDVCDIYCLTDLCASLTLFERVLLWHQSTLWKAPLKLV